MKIRKQRAISLGLIAAGTALGSGHAYAQTAPATEAAESTPADDSAAADSAQEGEIIVTARRRAEPLQRTPVAVTAISEVGLQNMTIRNVQDVGALAPNLEIQNGRTSGTNAFIFIRGIGQGDDAPAFEPGVAQYVDDVYLGRVSGGLMNIADVASVEILRGPQGTLYGKNTIGGAFKITSKVPEPDFSGTATLGYGNYDQFLARGAINIPLSDTLYMRVSGERLRNDGFMSNSFTGQREHNQDSYSGRVMLRFAPSDSIDLLLSGDLSRAHSNGNSGRIVATADTFVGGLVEAFIGDISPYVLQDRKDFFKGSFDIAVDPLLPTTRPKESANGVSSRLRIGGDNLSFTSITAYRTLHSFTRLDVDGTPLQIAHLIEDIDQNQFSQEFQLAGEALGGRLNWIGGLYYYSENMDVRGYATLAPAFKDAFGLDLSQTDFAHLQTKSYAGYANAGFKITPSLTISLGGRFTHEKRTTDDVIETSLDGTEVRYGPLSSSTENDRFLPRIGLEYQATPDIFAYATYATGFKSGGFDADRPFGPEKATSYEAGLKTQWLNRHLTLNLAGFYVKYDGIQLAVVTVVDDAVVEIVSNASKATLYGGEAELNYRSGGASFFANFGYTKAKYNEYFDLILGDLSGRKFPYTPVFSATIGGDYTFAVGSNHSGFVGFDVAYKTKTFTDVPNTPELVQKPYAVLNGRIALRGPEDKYEIAVFGKNLTNTRYYQYGISLLDSFGFGLAWQGAPRTYGVEATIRF